MLKIKTQTKIYTPKDPCWREPMVNDFILLGQKQGDKIRFIIMAIVMACLGGVMFYTMLINGLRGLTFRNMSYEYRVELKEHSRAVLSATEPIITVSITKFGWTGNKMANGEYPHIGAVAISDRSIPLGTVVIIDGVKYIVKDRTAKWVHEKFGLTIDIYTEESVNDMLKFGRQKKDVLIKI